MVCSFDALGVYGFVSLPEAASVYQSNGVTLTLTLMPQLADNLAKQVALVLEHYHDQMTSTFESADSLLNIIIGHKVADGRLRLGRL